MYPPYRGSLLVASLVLTLAACGGGAARQQPVEDSPATVAKAAPSVAASAEVLASDTPRTTVDGHGFVAPAGWSIEVRGPAVVLTAPEGDSRLALVDVGATDADAAVAEAWAAYDPRASWPLKLAEDRPARNGWDQSRTYTYELSANEQRTVWASARRHGKRWTVTVYDMSTAVGEMRGAQVSLVLGRLFPKGYARESFADKPAHSLDATRLAQLREFVETARTMLDVPGVALGIVQDGKVVLAEGFGLRELGEPDPVDAQTLFMVASNTKALTTLMLAKLVEQGRFGWDTPVTQLLPQFRLGDSNTTRQVLVRHLVCACTGLPRQDMEWIFASENATPDSVLATLATMQPTSKFGDLYQYSNPMAAAAGFVGAHTLHPEKELGAAYDAAMQTLVFDPLGMHATTFDTAIALRGDHAMPHSLDVNGKTRAASMAGLNRAIYAARPAGAAWSNIDDMLRYVRMELANGVLPEGDRYIDAAALLERRKPQVASGNDSAYGMGLEVDRTWGVPVVFHGGALVGFHSDMYWLPEHGVGAVVLTNSDMGYYLHRAFSRRLLEVLFDGKLEAAENVAAQAQRVRDNLAAERKRLTVPADVVTVAKLATLYENAQLGGIAVMKDAASLRFDFGGWHSDIASRRNDDGSLSFVTVSPGESGIEFVLRDSDGALLLRDAQHEYVFSPAKRADPAAK